MVTGISSRNPQLWPRREKPSPPRKEPPAEVDGRKNPEASRSLLWILLVRHGSGDYPVSWPWPKRFLAEQFNEPVPPVITIFMMSKETFRDATCLASIAQPRSGEFYCKHCDGHLGSDFFELNELNFLIRASWP